MPVASRVFADRVVAWRGHLISFTHARLAAATICPYLAFGFQFRLFTSGIRLSEATLSLFISLPFSAPTIEYSVLVHL